MQARIRKCLFHQIDRINFHTPVIFLGDGANQGENHTIAINNKATDICFLGVLENKFGEVFITALLIHS